MPSRQTGGGQQPGGLVEPAPVLVDDAEVPRDPVHGLGAGVGEEPGRAQAEQHLAGDQAVEFLGREGGGRGCRRDDGVPADTGEAGACTGLGVRAGPWACAGTGVGGRAPGGGSDGVRGGVLEGVGEACREVGGQVAHGGVLEEQRGFQLLPHHLPHGLDQAEHLRGSRPSS